MEHISKAQIKMVRGLKLKKNRDEAGLFVAEGHKCIEELERYFEPMLKVFKILSFREARSEGMEE